MRHGILALIAATLAVPVIAQNLQYEPDAAWWPPAEAAARGNPLAARPELSAGGKKMFVRNCVECHGREGTGMESKHSADLQLAVVQQQSDGTLFWKITNGNAKRGMPSFSKIPEMQRWQIVLYIRTLKPLNTSNDAQKQ